MNKQTIKRLLNYIKPYTFLVLIIVLLSLFTALSSLLVPVLLGQCIDLLIGLNKVNVLLLFEKVIIVAFVIVIVVISQWLLSRQTNKITYLISYDLRKATYSKIHTLPLSYIDIKSQGELVNHIINDVELVSSGLLQSFTSLFTGVVTIIGTVVILCFINLEVAMIIIFLTPVSLFVAMFIAKKTHKRFQRQLNLRGELSGLVNEMVTNIDIVQAFNYQEISEEKFEEINQKLHSNGILFQFYGALINPTTRFINSFIYNLIGIVGSLYVLGGSLTVGMLSSFLTYANQYTKPFNEISAVVNEMQSAVVASQRIFDFLDQGNEKDNGVIEVEDKDIKGKVSFNNVSFRYQKNKPLLENISSTIEAGKKIAIVGQTGSGKTTLINLLMRFYDIDSGNIFIDDYNLYDFKKSSLRSLFGMVLQDSWLFTGTIEENIAFGLENYCHEDIIGACKKAMIHDYIESLPKGYQTILGENGITLSKGQQQLICIARIMLINPPILLLDEATSSIDTRTESKIQDAFNLIMKDKTTFIVAHRLSTIKSADTILVMEQGTIVEQGSHDELMLMDGFYKQLHQSQYGK